MFLSEPAGAETETDWLTGRLAEEKEKKKSQWGGAPGNRLFVDRKQNRPHVEAQKCALLFAVVAFLCTHTHTHTHTGSSWRLGPSSFPGISWPSIFQRADHYAVDRRLETRGRSDCLFRKLEDAAYVYWSRRKKTGNTAPFTAISRPQLHWNHQYQWPRKGAVNPSC